MISIHHPQDGIEILLETVAHYSTVSMGFFFPFGSNSETPRTRGFTHLLEHLILKSSGAKRDAIRKLETFGVDISGYTEREELGFTFTFPASNFSEVLPLVCEMLLQPQFTMEEVNTEKEIVRAEILQAMEDPEDTAFEQFWKSQFPDDHPIAGSLGNIEKLQFEELIEFTKDVFQESKFLISIAGNITVKEVTEAFGKLDLTARNGIIEQKSYQIPTIWPKPRLFKYSSETAHIILHWWQEPIKKLEDHESFSFLSFLLGENLSSPLFTKFREELGLCYQINTFLTDLEDISGFGIYAAVPKEMTKKFLNEFQNFQKTLTKESINIRSHETFQGYLGFYEVNRDSMEFRMKNNAFYYAKFSEKDHHPSTMPILNIEFLKQQPQTFILGSK